MSREDTFRFSVLLGAGVTLAFWDTVAIAYLTTRLSLFAAARGSEAMVWAAEAARGVILHPMASFSEVACRRAAELAGSLHGAPERMWARSTPALLTVVRGDFGLAMVQLGDAIASLEAGRRGFHEQRDFLEQMWMYACSKTGGLLTLQRRNEERLRESIRLGRPFPASFSRVTRMWDYLARGRLDCACTDFEPARGDVAQLRLSKTFGLLCMTLCYGRPTDVPAALQAFVDERKQMDPVPMLKADMWCAVPVSWLVLWDMEGRRSRTLRRVEKEAKVIGKQQVLFAPAQAAALHAGVAARRKQFAEAARLFDDAVHGFGRASMKMHAAACRIRRGEILGGDEGRALIATAEATMREEGVVKPEQFAQCYAPRFPLR